jgi:hypothetical protein
MKNRPGGISHPRHEPLPPWARLTDMGCNNASNQTGVTIMIRNFVLAAAAIAALGTVSLSATPASAKGFHGGGFHGGHGGHFRGGIGFYGYSGYSCLRNVWVVTRFGDSVLRTINVCD